MAWKIKKGYLPNGDAFSETEIHILEILSKFPNGITREGIYEKMLDKGLNIDLEHTRNSLQDLLQDLYHKGILSDCLIDSELHYVLTTMVEKGGCGCRQIDLTPYLHYKIIKNNSSTLVEEDILELGEFLDLISNSKVYEEKKDKSE